MIHTTPPMDPAIKCWNIYATDGRCHASEDGTRECGRPAVWIGERETPGGLWRCGFCDQCKREGRGSKAYARWYRLGRDERRGDERPSLPEPEPDEQITTRAPTPASAQWWAATLGRLNAGAAS